MSKNVSNVPFSVPKPAWERATKDTPHSAHLSFLNLQGDLLNDFHCEGGPMRNRSRMYILDKKGNFSAVKDDTQMLVNMENAAMDGRLFFRDFRNQLHQISLKQNESFEYDLTVSEALTQPVVPPRPDYYFIKNLLGKIFSYFYKMVEEYNDWKNFSDATTKFMNEYNRGQAPGSDATLKYAKVKEQPEVQEQQPEVQVAEPAGVAPQEQMEEPELSVAELLQMNPMDMTVKQFESYLSILDQRGQGDLAMEVILDPQFTLDKYYEALARELEGSVAGQLLGRLESMSAERKNEVLQEQKPVFAAMSRDLRQFVRNYPERENKDLADQYHGALADNVSTFTLQVEMMKDVQMIRGDAMGKYLEVLNRQNEAAKQAQPQQAQSQPEPQVQAEPVRGAM